jgi:hypothetical protein
MIVIKIKSIPFRDLIFIKEIWLSSPLRLGLAMWLASLWEGHFHTA